MKFDAAPIQSLMSFSQFPSFLTSFHFYWHITCTTSWSATVSALDFTQLISIHLHHQAFLGTVDRSSHPHPSLSQATSHLQMEAVACNHFNQSSSTTVSSLPPHVYMSEVNSQKDNTQPCLTHRSAANQTKICPTTLIHTLIALTQSTHCACPAQSPLHVQLYSSPALVSVLYRGYSIAC